MVLQSHPHASLWDRVGQTHPTTSKWHQESYSAIGSVLVLNISSAVLLLLDVKGHEIYVRYLLLCHFDVKSLEPAAVISYPDQKKNIIMENTRPWRKCGWEIKNKLMRRSQYEICHGAWSGNWLNLFIKKKSVTNSSVVFPNQTVLCWL